MFLPSRMLIITQSSFGVWCVVQSRVLTMYIDFKGSNPKVAEAGQPG
jgi:hypothetical protein